MKTSPAVGFIEAILTAAPYCRPPPCPHYYQLRGHRRDTPASSDLKKVPSPSGLYRLHYTQRGPQYYILQSSLRSFANKKSQNTTQLQRALHVADFQSLKEVHSFLTNEANWTKDPCHPNPSASSWSNHSTGRHCPNWPSLAEPRFFGKKWWYQKWSPSWRHIQIQTSKLHNSMRILYFAQLRNWCPPKVPRNEAVFVSLFLASESELVQAAKNPNDGKA